MQTDQKGSGVLPKILVVEDDIVVLRVLEWRLQNLGYEVCGKAETGEEALDLVASKEPDIVLMDINIRGDVDGIETARIIKKNNNIPVIFVTSHSEDEMVRRAKEIHPDGFIRKPFEDDDLRVAIQLALKE
jgi:CheY-like chemotaxis protein